ncbi:unnamed protein product [Closterium sp. Yama58-4]|nr:unnamed protein product [Closterium sp. Yama58-4]
MVPYKEPIVFVKGVQLLHCTERVDLSRSPPRRHFPQPQHAVPPPSLPHPCACDCPRCLASTPPSRSLTPLPAPKRLISRSARVLLSCFATRALAASPASRRPRAASRRYAAATVLVGRRSAYSRADRRPLRYESPSRTAHGRMPQQQGGSALTLSSSPLLSSLPHASPCVPRLSFTLRLPQFLPTSFPTALDGSSLPFSACAGDGCATAAPSGALEIQGDARTHALSTQVANSHVAAAEVLWRAERSGAVCGGERAAACCHAAAEGAERAAGTHGAAPHPLHARSPLRASPHVAPLSPAHSRSAHCNLHHAFHAAPHCLSAHAAPFAGANPIESATATWQRSSLFHRAFHASGALPAGASCESIGPQQQFHSFSSHLVRSIRPSLASHSQAPQRQRQQQRQRGRGQDYYAVLGVSRKATAAEIKKAFYALAKKYHPDANKDDPNAAKKFQEVQQAYEVLKDDEKRAMYDQVGPEAFEGGAAGGPGAGAGAQGFGGFSGFGGPSDFEEMLGGIFGRMGGMGGMGGMGMGMGMGAAGPRGGESVQMAVRLTLREAVDGCSRHLSFSAPVRCSSCSGSGMPKGYQPTPCKACKGQGMEMRRMGASVVMQTCSSCGGQGVFVKEWCKTCHGEGTVKERREVDVSIPAGVDSGVTLRVPGQGGAGGKGAPPGDLLLNIQVEEDAVFKRDGNDIHVDLHVSFPQACLGASVPVPTLSGEVILKIKPGTQPGQVLQLRDKGTPPCSAPTLALAIPLSAHLLHR